MLYISIVLLFLAVVANCNPIVRGKKVLSVEHPFVVHITMTQYEFVDENKPIKVTSYCGGNIITRRTILTAAHCIDDSITIPEGEIHAGSVYKKNFSKRGKTVQMNGYFIHDDYLAKKIDLALIYLEKDLNLERDVIEVAALTEVKLNDVVTVTGWGLIEFNGKTDILRKATMQVTTRDARRTYGYDTTKFLYLMDPLKVKTFCHGDSGGPVVYENGVAGVLIGGFGEDIIFSDRTKINVCSAKTPAIAVNIKYFVRWIRANSI